MDDQMIILETDRLCLRRTIKDDVPALVDLWTDPEVTRYMGGPRDRTKFEKIFREDAENPFAEKYDLWPVVEKRSNEMIGDCGLLQKEVEGKDEIEIIYILKSSAWGKGFATEIGQAIKEYAFKEMKIKRLIALIEPENEASEMVARKIGMIFEKEVVRQGGVKRKVYVIEAEDQGSAA